MTANFDVVDDVEKILGSNGSIIQVYKDGEKTERAGKVINRSMYPKYKREIETLRLLRGECSNVVSFFTVLDSGLPDFNPIILMELCDCNLKTYVENDELFVPLSNRNIAPMHPKQYFDDLTSISLAKQICKGVDFLHKENIIHGTITPKSILLIKQSEQTVAKLASYGFSKTIGENDSGAFYSTDCEKRGYTAHEFVRNNKIRKSVDIFSLGLVLFYVFSNGKHLYGKKPDQWQRKIDKIETEKGQNFSDLRQTEACTTKYNLTREQAVCAVDLIKKMVKREQSNRCNIQEVLHNPIFWLPRCKIQFYETVHRYLKTAPSCPELERYPLDLLSGNNSGEASFKVSPADLPFAVDLAHRHSGARECNSVRGLIQVIRNMAQHVTDKSTHTEIKKCLGVTEDGTSYDAAVFLEAMTHRYPQLLAHVYEVFRSKNIPGGFYPRQRTASGTASTSADSTRSPNREAVQPAEVPTASIPTGVKDLLKKHHILEEDLFKCDLEIFFAGKRMKLKTIDLINPLLISGPDYTQSRIASIRLPHSENKTVESILKELNMGLVLSRGTDGCSLTAKRESIIRIFCPEKMEQMVEVVFFPIVDFLVDPTKFSVDEFTFLIGTDPADKKVSVHAIKVVLKPFIVQKIREQAVNYNFDLQVQSKDIQKSGSFKSS